MSSKVEKVRASLEGNNIATEYFEQAEEACKAVLAAIPDNATVGLGGSTTVKQIGLLDALRQRKLRVFDQYAEGLSAEESTQLRRAGLTVEYYITSTNAITEDGQLVNVDGIGNRVAAQIFGPRHVFIVASTHKIVKDVPAALERIRTVAAPANAPSFIMDPAGSRHPAVRRTEAAAVILSVVFICLTPTHSHRNLAHPENQSHQGKKRLQSFPSGITLLQ